MDKCLPPQQSGEEVVLRGNMGTAYCGGGIGVFREKKIKRIKNMNHFMESTSFMTLLFAVYLFVRILWVSVHDKYKVVQNCTSEKFLTKF